MSSSDGKVNSNSNQTLKSKWQELSGEKKFGLITLLSLGSALFITGRTARALTKRIPKFTGQPIQSTQSSSIPSSKSNQNELNSNLSKSNNHIKLSSAEILAPTPQSFWDNKSILCVKDERYETEKELKFNPALDAVSALGIATCIVLFTTSITLKILSQRWELDSWEDWRMFIQGGYLGPILIPKGWNEWVSNQIPKSVRFSSNLNQTSEEDSLRSSTSLNPQIDSDHQWEWKEKLDQEWKVEFDRREIERKEWVSKRALAGKRIW
ncbi:hypothetical protein DFH28DRAFT_309206 [Melampsora americana]|nr:hypothetical protein DFH28DRAFT_309206 [Melampsora americana]